MQTETPGSTVCANCGNPLRPEQIVCLKCGAPVAQQTSPETKKAEGKSKSILHFGICVLAILFSFIGIGIIADLRPGDFLDCSPMFGIAFLMIMILIVIAMFVRRNAIKNKYAFLKSPADISVLAGIFTCIIAMFGINAIQKAMFYAQNADSDSSMLDAAWRYRSCFFNGWAVIGAFFAAVIAFIITLLVVKKKK